eukprot:TRINITY_DN4362_c0_g1_i1.p1 TRINITY_DN4362_c0_g1~~TRINITY_DN4362_c0_g1_i1.p1  ORF type:complete len:588 (-),score=80.76 TRINITY_DN4362_c0_g1_i1:368-2131(-)
MKQPSDETGSSLLRHVQQKLQIPAKPKPPANDIDRSDWVTRALKNNPGIKDLRDRVSPINRAVTFGCEYGSKEPINSNLLNSNQILQLITQHLDYEGLSATVLSLRQHAKIQQSYPDLNESRLVTLLRIALEDTERIYDLTIADKHVVDQLDDDLEEHLNDLEILEEESVDQDTNIWNTPTDLSTPTILYEKVKVDGQPVVKAGTLNRLVQHLTNEKTIDMTYKKSFLMMYSTFTTPEKLLAKLMERYYVPVDEFSKCKKDMTREEWQSMTVVPIQLRVCNVLRKWIDDFEDELKSSRLLRNLKAFIENGLKADGHKVLAQNMTNSLNRKISSAYQNKMKTFPDPPPPPIVTKVVFSHSLTMMDIDELEIARQLTLIEFETFSAIKPSELRNQSWNKAKHRHRAPSVLKMISRFNDISGWVASTIMNEAKIRNRSRVMTKFIRIAGCLRKLNNFNSLMAIIAGLNTSAVYRLKWTKAEMPKGVQQILLECETLMKSEGSFSNYRSVLQNADPPCMPYLGVYLTDLTFIDDGNPDYIDGLINFTKRRHFYSVRQIQDFLLKFPRTEESVLWDMSQVREPRKVDRSEIL